MIKVFNYDASKYEKMSNQKLVGGVCPLFQFKHQKTFFQNVLWSTCGEGGGRVANSTDGFVCILLLAG
jgi:hypothetical protein